MTTTYWVGAAMTAVGLLVTLVADRGERPMLEWVSKPLAAVGFLVAAVGAGCFASPYGSVLFVGLVFCVGGDVLLIPRGSKGAFLGGLGSFLLGHVVFAVAFFVRGVELQAVGLAAIPLIMFGVGVLRWLGPHVPDRMVLPVRAYIAAILIMVAAAAGASALGGPKTIVIGALAFMVSDLFVARNRFVAPGLVNRVWGLPLYFGGQLVLASTAAG